MPTNLAIDDNLIEQALIIGHHRTKKAVVTEALNEYIQRRKQVEILFILRKIMRICIIVFKLYRRGYDASISTIK